MALSALELFGELPDPRRSQGRRHLLAEVITLVILAVICGAEGPAEIELFGRSKRKWLKTFLSLPHGIPSHDTIGRIMALIEPAAFEALFSRWVAGLAEQIAGVVAIDGKTLRRSFDRAAEKSPIHLVSAWAAENAMVFGQVATDEKSNEITAIPQLLRMLSLKGLIITIDAMGCQKEIARQVVDGEGDYVLQVKANQPALHQELQELFDWATPREFKGMDHVHSEHTGKGHGRIETRCAWVTSDLRLVHQASRWAGLRTVAMIECRRTVDGKTSTERRYLISSLPLARAEALVAASRSHWGIENGLHWRLDVCFGEDSSRIRTGHGAENFSRVRRIALNLLQAERTEKASIKGKRLRAGWDHDYLLTILRA